jgi:hypothetical protein
MFICTHLLIERCVSVVTKQTNDATPPYLKLVKFRPLVHTVFDSPVFVLLFFSGSQESTKYNT